MLYSTLAFTAVAFASLASAQNYTTSGPLNVTASQIDPALRQSWCTGQRNNCPLICGGSYSANGCDPTNLSYNCVCASGNTPNISAYMETMPFYICQQWITNCVDSHPDDRAGQQGCRSVTCGTMKVAAASSGNTAASGSATGTTASTVVAGGAASSGSATATTSMMTTTTAAANTASSSTTTSSRAGAATILAIAQNYGTPVLAAGMFAAFGLAL